MAIGRTRHTKAIEVGTYEDRIGFTLTFDTDEREHFLFSRPVARDLALKLLHVLDRTHGRPAGDDIGIQDSSNVRLTDPEED